MNKAAVTGRIRIRLHEQHIKADGPGSALCDVIDDLAVKSTRPLAESAQLFQAAIIDIDDDDVLDGSALPLFPKQLDPFEIAPVQRFRFKGIEQRALQAVGRQQDEAGGCETDQTAGEQTPAELFMHRTAPPERRGRRA